MKAVTTKNFDQVSKRMQEVGLDIVQVKKEISFAIQLINKSSQLQKASPESKQAAVLNVAQCGLTLNPVMKLAYLVPRWDNQSKTISCCLEPSYQGLVKLLTDTKSITAVNAQLVYKNDNFQYNASDFDNPIIHNPDPFEDRGKVVGVYAISILPSGVKQAEVMNLEELHKIRAKSESYKAFIAKKIKSCIWTTDEGEMYRKTVIRRIVKYLPKSEQYDKVAKAISLDEFDYKPSESKKQFARDLLENSGFIEVLEISAFETAIETGDNDKLTETIEILKGNQIDTGRYSQTEIGQIVSDKVDQPNS